MKTLAARPPQGSIRKPRPPYLRGRNRAATVRPRLTGRDRHRRLTEREKEAVGGQLWRRRRRAMVVDGDDGRRRRSRFFNEDNGQDSNANPTRNYAVPWLFYHPLSHSLKES